MIPKTFNATINLKEGGRASVVVRESRTQWIEVGGTRRWSKTTGFPRPKVCSPDSCLNTSSITPRQ